MDENVVQKLIDLVEKVIETQKEITVLIRKLIELYKDLKS